MNAGGIIDVGGERITNLGEPTNSDHAATKAYVDAGGGSQPGAAYVVGPYTVGCADIAAAGASKDLFTIPTGHLVLTWWTDPNAFTAFTNGSAVWLGQGATFVTSDGVDGTWGKPSDNSNANDGEVQAAGGNRNDLTGTTALTTLQRPATTDKVEVLNSTAGATTQTAGSIDLYFLLCTAPTVI